MPHRPEKHRTANRGARTTESTVLARRLSEARLNAFLGRAAEVSHDSEPDELGALVSRTADLFSRSVAEVTRATYSRRWAIFEAWCAERGLASLPAQPEVVMMHFAQAASVQGVALSTLRGWSAAINRVHLEAGLPSPGDDPAMTMFLRGLSRAVPRSATGPPISALRIEGLREVCRHLDRIAVDPVEVRDRALLTLNAAGLNDAEIGRLRWSGTQIAPKAVILEVRAAGTEAPKFVRLTASKNTNACPVRSIISWHEVAGDDPDPMFTLVDHHGHRSDQPFDAKAVRRIRRSRRNSLGHGGRWAPLDASIALLGNRSSAVLRDKALLLLGFAGAFRRNEVTQLRWSDITAAEQGLIVHLQRSKTDQAGRGRDVGIPRGQSRLTCPVTAMQDWQERCEQQLGAEAIVDAPCFVKVGRAGRIGTEAITTQALTMLVRRRAEGAGLTGRWGGRSLRAGFISTAADLDIPLELIARQSRHATLDSLVLYIREDDPLRRNPVARMGL